ncbi:hypothetical protein QBC39DRAFT_110654 [Podospora conica]|nr:hypothetical protein QBC39DRAFT_110654 [Schizothecium conicum]
MLQVDCGRACRAKTSQLPFVACRLHPLSHSPTEPRNLEAALIGRFPLPRRRAAPISGSRQSTDEFELGTDATVCGGSSLLQVLSGRRSNPRSRPSVRAASVRGSSSLREAFLVESVLVSPFLDEDPPFAKRPSLEPVELPRPRNASMRAMCQAPRRAAHTPTVPGTSRPRRRQDKTHPTPSDGMPPKILCGVSSRLAWTCHSVRRGNFLHNTSKSTVAPVVVSRDRKASGGFRDSLPPAQ